MILSESTKAILWKAFLLVLPISSFTILSRILGNTNVAPLALIPMLIILLLWWLPQFFKVGRSLPYNFSLYYFSFCWSPLNITHYLRFHFQGVGWYKGILEVVASFAMGVGFYLVTIYMVKTKY